VTPGKLTASPGNPGGMVEILSFRQVPIVRFDSSDRQYGHFVLPL
jgi:hypothetical protein